MAKENIKRVVMTGIGPITSAGMGVKNLWDGVMNQRTGLELVEERLEKDLWDKYYVHQVNGFDIKNFGLNREMLGFIEDWKENPLDMDLQYLLASIKLALDDGNIDYQKEAEKNIGLIVTNESPGTENFVEKMLNETYEAVCKNKKISRKEYYNDIYLKIVKHGYETQSFMTLFHIAKVFGVKKNSLFINNACASGLYALEAASNMIKLSKAPMVVIASGDHANIFKHLWFKMIGMYQEDGKIKPFSKNGKGLVMGEGATAFVLEDYEHALKRKANIYAEYLGGGFRLEGWQVTRPQVGAQSYQETMKEAIEESHIKKEDLDLLCLHGFGTKVGDYYEAKAVMDVFGSDIPVTAFKPYVGHNLGGSTLMETAILLLSLKNNFVPPILNTKDINPQIDLNLVLKGIKKDLKIVMKTCAAFAGFNAASVFRKLK